MATFHLSSCHRVAILFALSAALLLCATYAFELPEKAYMNMQGEWSVEIASPCSSSFATGTAVIANDSSAIVLPSVSAAVPLTRPATTSGDAPLTLYGLERFLSSDAGTGTFSIQYRPCRTQTNYLATERRPNYGARMKSTQLTEISGALLATPNQNEMAPADPCDKDSPASLGDVILRLVGMPMEGVTADGRVREAVQYAELLIDTRHLPGSCKALASSEAAEKKPRKRRGGRNSVGVSGTSSEDAESAVARGYAVIRLFKKSPPTKSFFERFYASIAFAALFLIYRVVYGYFSYQGGK